MEPYSLNCPRSRGRGWRTEEG